MQDRAFYERIGAKFQSERERQKITREHMAEQINISSKFLYEIESGRKGFSCEIFRNMCKYLHVNADYILEEDDVASSQMRIETMTRDFSIEEMNYLVKMIEGIREMRKHVAWYTKGLHGAARLRDRINQVESYVELENLLTSL